MRQGQHEVASARRLGSKGKRRSVGRPFVPFYVPYIGRREVRLVGEALRSGWLTSGPKVTLFEKRLGGFVGARHAIAVNSGTAALHLSLIAQGVGAGDEVITSPYTFVATGEAILYVGARPVFADIVPETLNMDPKAVRRALTARTAAIVPVHMAGLPCDLGPIHDLARKHGVSVIDDAAHALGAYIGDRPVGAISSMTCFSFYATKNLTTGEGGIVTTNDGRAAEKVRLLSLHGLTRDAWRRYGRGGAWRYDVLDLGHKYNMTDLAAALGLAQLSRFRWMQARRRALARRYSSLLEASDAFDLPREYPDSVHAWHLYVIRIRPGLLRIGRDRMIHLLRRRGIGTSVHFLPLHLHRYYRRTFGYRRGSFPLAERESERAISLPLYPGLSKGAQDRVVEALLGLATRYRR